MQESHSKNLGELHRERLLDEQAIEGGSYAPEMKTAESDLLQQLLSMILRAFTDEQKVIRQHLTLEDISDLTGYEMVNSELERISGAYPDTLFMITKNRYMLTSTLIEKILSTFGEKGELYMSIGDIHTALREAYGLKAFSKQRLQQLLEGRDLISRKLLESLRDETWEALEKVSGLQKKEEETVSIYYELKGTSSAKLASNVHFDGSQSRAIRTAGFQGKPAVASSISWEEASGRVIEIAPEFEDWKTTRLYAWNANPRLVEALIEKGFVKLGDLHGLSRQDLKEALKSENTIVSNTEQIQKQVSELISADLLHKPDVILWMEESFKGERNREVLLKRAEGATLEQVGREVGVTRERIRQVESKAASLVMNTLKHRLGPVLQSRALLFDHKIDNMLAEGILGEEYLKILKYCIGVSGKDFPWAYWKKMDLILCDLKQGDLQVLTRLEDENPKSIDESYIRNWIERAVDIGIRFMDRKNFEEYVISLGYRKAGREYVRYAVSMRNAAKMAMDELSDEIFKVDDPEDEIILKHLLEKNGARASESRKSFWNAVTENMVLCGKSMYCSPKRIRISMDLLEDICSYIDENVVKGIFYKDLFLKFENRLMKESNIDNYDFLHGTMMHMKPGRYNYTKGSLFRLSHEHEIEGSPSFLNDFLKERKRHVPKDEILENIKGLTDIQISYTQEKYPQVLHWEEKTYYHASHINLNSMDKAGIDAFLLRDCMGNNGYSSSFRLFRWLSEKHQDALERWGVNNDMNAFGVAQYLLKESYEFSYPHIVSDWNMDRRFNTKDLVEKFLGEKASFSREEVLIMFEEIIGKRTSSLYSVVNDLCNEYYRADEDTFISGPTIGLDGQTIDIIQAALNANFEERAVLSPGIHKHWSNGLPDIGYAWNPYLLGSVIEHHLADYVVIGKSFSRKAIYNFAKKEEGITTAKEALQRLLNDEYSGIKDTEDLNSFIIATGLFRKTPPPVSFEGGQFKVAGPSGAEDSGETDAI